jgi:hypothetical protein
LSAGIRYPALTTALRTSVLALPEALTARTA